MIELYELQSAFEKAFGINASVVVAAPGRVNLIGEHVDYNDGLVLPLAIDRYTVIAGRPCDRDSSRIFNINLQTMSEIGLSPEQLGEQTSWTRYVAGVAIEFQQQQIHLPNFDAVIWTNVPIGAGLASSAALEVATATLFEALSGTTLSSLDKALLCQKVEHRHVGVPCGLMDQYCSVFASENALLLIDCQANVHRQIPLPNREVDFLVVDTGVQHQLADSEYALRRSQCEQAIAKLSVDSWRDIASLSRSDEALLSPIELKRARHIVTEIARTARMAEVIAVGDWEAAGQLMYKSHESLRDDFEVSCSELDVLVEITRGLGVNSGVYGSRMTGGGFGGCTISLVRRSQSSAIVQAMTERYQAAIGRQPDCFVTTPARGAHVISLN